MNDDRTYSISLRLFLWFLLTVVIISGSGILALQNILNIKSGSQQVNTSYETITALQDTLSATKDIQSSTRGYIITGREEYLAIYNGAVADIPLHINTLKRLLAEQTLDPSLLKEFEEAVEARVRISQDTIATYQQRGPQEAVAMISGGGGQRNMEQVIAAASNIEAAQRAMLRNYQAGVSHTFLTTMTLSGFGILCYLGILSFVFWMVRREIMLREQTERMLYTDNQSLEHSSKKLATTNLQIKNLSEMVGFLQSCRSTEEVCDVIKRYIPGLLPESSGVLGLLHHDSDTVRIALSWGKDILSKSDFAASACWALRRGRRHHHTPRSYEPICEHLKNSHTKHSICLPILAQGETGGVMCLGRADDKSLSENTIKTAQEILKHVSLILSNLKLQEKLYTQSVRDPLTGLFNRRYLEESLAREISRAKRNEKDVAILMIDIDHFKVFNDTHGHEAGDLLLKELGALLIRHVRNEDIACRYGGEEFILMLPSANIENACLRADQLRQIVSQLTLPYEGKTLEAVTLSIGIATYPAHGDSGQEAIRAADRALYQAKQNGRNQIVTAPNAQSDAA